MLTKWIIRHDIQPVHAHTRTAARGSDEGQGGCRLLRECDGLGCHGATGGGWLHRRGGQRRLPLRLQNWCVTSLTTSQARMTHVLGSRLFRQMAAGAGQRQRCDPAVLRVVLRGAPCARCWRSRGRVFRRRGRPQRQGPRGSGKLLRFSSGACHIGRKWSRARRWC